MKIRYNYVDKRNSTKYNCALICLQKDIYLFDEKPFPNDQFCYLYDENRFQKEHLSAPLRFI